MSNKTLATHLYCLFIFVAGCVVFWLFGGGEEPENNHVDNKEEIVAQPAAEKLAMEEVQKNVEENDSIDQSTELQEEEFISTIAEDDAAVDLSDSKAPLKANSKRGGKRQEESESKDNESAIPSSTSNIEKSAGFHRMGESNEKKTDNLINAVIHERLKNINEGSLIKLRLMDEVTVEGVSIPKNTVVFATARLSADRVYLTTETVTYKKKDYPFNAEVYDLDGMEGLDMTDKNMVLPAGYKVTIKQK